MGLLIGLAVLIFWGARLSVDKGKVGYYERRDKEVMRRAFERRKAFIEKHVDEDLSVEIWSSRIERTDNLERFPKFNPQRLEEIRRIKNMIIEDLKFEPDEVTMEFVISALYGKIPSEAIEHYMTSDCHKGEWGIIRRFIIWYNDLLRADGVEEDLYWMDIGNIHYPIRDYCTDPVCTSLRKNVHSVRALPLVPGEYLLFWQSALYEKLYSHNFPTIHIDPRRIKERYYKPDDLIPETVPLRPELYNYAKRKEVTAE